MSDQSTPPRSDDTPWLFDRVRRFLGVMSPNSQYFYFDCFERIAQPRSRWLEVGCGSAVIPGWMIWTTEQRRALLDRFDLSVGLDLDFEYMKPNTEVHHKVMGTVERLPVAADSFDLVTANMVFEHVAEPVGALKEVRRVLKPGGRMLFHTPNVLYPLMLAGHLADAFRAQKLKNKLVHRIEGRAERHVFPTVYRLNTPWAIRRAARRAGLEVVELHAVESIPSSMRKANALATAEILFMWITRVLRLRFLRSNLVVVLRKPE